MEKIRTDIYREALKKQPPENEVGFVVIWKKGSHPVQEMQGFRVPGERKG